MGAEKVKLSDGREPMDVMVRGRVINVLAER